MSSRISLRGKGLLLLAAIAVLLLSACKGEETTKKTTSSPGATATSSDGESPEAAKSAGPGSGAGKLATPSSLPAKGQALQPEDVRPADPGTYSFDESGVRKVTGCAPDEPPATPSTLRVDPADGDRQHSIRDQRYSDGHGIVSNNVLEFRTDGVYLVQVKQTQTFPLLGTFTSEFEPSPPVQVFPANPKVGETWKFTMKSKDGKVNVESSNTLESSGEKVALGGGENLQSARIKGTTHVTGESPLGPMDFTENTTTWVSIEARLIVKTISDASGSVGTCRLDGTHIEAVLRSTTPS